MILEQTARLLMDHVREDDRVIRMSGDDFLIILIGCSQKKAREKAAEFSEASSKIPYSIHDGGYVRLRIGVASNEHFDQKSETLKKMIDNALTEMNQVLT